jgi:hypothetical protein
MRRVLTTLIALVMGGALLVGCGNDDADVEETTDDVTDDIEEGARDAWASLRTGWERVIDDVATGDVDAQVELLEECRDTLQDLREAGDESADDVQSLCDAIRDADEDTDWDAIRAQYDELDARY